MPTLVKIANKNLNLSLLTEELGSVGLDQHSLLMAGFRQQDERTYVPNAARKIIARRTTPGGEVVDEADPGELRFTSDAAFTVAQESSLDGVLVSHDAAVLTAEQEREDLDAKDLDQLVRDYAGWDTMSRPQKDVVTKRVVRLLVRNSLSDAPI